VNSRFGLRIGAAVAVALIASCADDGSGPANPAAQLDAARSLWDRVGPGRYTFVAQRICECVPDAIGPVQVRVENGAVVAVVRVASQVAIDPELWFTVDELFALIETELAQRPALLEVEYDSQDGHPIEVAYGQREVDAGAVIQISGFTPLTDVVPPYYQRAR
jgi:hypothetical protein